MLYNLFFGRACPSLKIIVENNYFALRILLDTVHIFHDFRQTGLKFSPILSWLQLIPTNSKGIHFRLGCSNLKRYTEY